MNRPDYISRTPRYYLEQLDPEILSSFSDLQIDSVVSLLQAAIPKPSPKIVDFRFTVDLLVSRFYLVLLVGKDRRKQQRDYQSRGITKVGNIVAAILLLIATNLTISALILLFAYLLKSAIGINLFPDHIAETVGKFWNNSN